jgi:hypothetical protein
MSPVFKVARLKYLKYLSLLKLTLLQASITAGLFYYRFICLPLAEFYFRFNNADYYSCYRFRIGLKSHSLLIAATLIDNIL